MTKTIVHIIHGMKEHMGRYQKFIEFLEENDLLAIGEDLEGHGQAALDEERLGVFRGNWFDIVEDQIDFIKRYRAKYPDYRYILLGHSMGSLLARNIVSFDSSLVDGLILTGTGQVPSIIPSSGYQMARVIEKSKGPLFHSNILDNLSLGQFNKTFEEETGVEWLSRDRAVQDAYLSDPLCNFMPTVSMYKGIFEGGSFVTKERNIAKIRKDLPILILSGEDDPVGEMGKGVHRFKDILDALKFEHVLTKLYPEARHEVLNELNKQEVYQDILNWIKTSH